MFFFFFQAEDGIRDGTVTGVQTCALPISTTIEIEIVCSDSQQHRQRVENRIPDISGLKLPTWDEVVSREYEPWPREHIVIDTAGRTVSDNVNELLKVIANQMGTQQTPAI